ncbi:MAG: hypothetical protein ACLVMF_09290 [Christensenellales bacterium]
MQAKRTSHAGAWRVSIAQIAVEMAFSNRIGSGTLMPLGGTAATVLSPLIKHIKFYQEIQEADCFLQKKKKHVSKKENSELIKHRKFYRGNQKAECFIKTQEAGCFPKTKTVQSKNKIKRYRKRKGQSPSFSFNRLVL